VYLIQKTGGHGLNGLSLVFHHRAQFRCEVSLYETCGGQSDIGAGFFSVYFISPPVSFILPVLHIHISFMYQ